MSVCTCTGDVLNFMLRFVLFLSEGVMSGDGRGGAHLCYLVLNPWPCVLGGGVLGGGATAVS